MPSLTDIMRKVDGVGHDLRKSRDEGHITDSQWVDMHRKLVILRSDFERIGARYDNTAMLSRLSDKPGHDPV